MAYNDDSVLARLSALNESHDSIATAAQWIMFHRRHADRTVALWMQRLKDSSSTKRLSLIYLANEVVQQSRIRHKEDFVIAFSPVVAEAAAVAYKGAPAEIQAKLRRVIDVWKDRAIFEAPIQAAIEARLSELDKARGSVKPGFGGSPFGSSASVPSEFAPLVSAHQTVTKLSVPLKSTIASANQEYEKQVDPTVAPPSAPVYAARLNGLLKTLANAESAVAECVKARETLISGLEKMLDAHRAALENEKNAAAELSGRKREIEDKKQQVEVAIMRALGPADGNGSHAEGESGSPPTELDRPEMEALTPPGMDNDYEDTAAGSIGVDEGAKRSEDAPTPEPAPAVPSTHTQSLPISINGSNKRRRVDDAGDFPDLGNDDEIDAEVAQMLKEGEGA
ncbi:uncharacterized protein TRIREDRAFT_80437 [Trichoderma reesei QM6a]|uniref:Predicted protein n=2 Tax=Hypocrea jecorina TaxID=51453 RepID=G0RR44_HYPJQ|nr:uncharacterized protein TRIREDRAFT_80437 [Trichoderma reesei QM6a]EGR46463.1 predicted protein [Trichoderma reesei QM6a]ETR99463.1 DUF618 domain protein [Trichoderma reesei RUT C-30]